MDIKNVIETYDSMFGKNSIEEIKKYLVDNINKAAETEDLKSQLALVNEIVSLCGATGDVELGTQYIPIVNELIIKLKLEQSANHGVALLNIANAYSAFGMYQRALHYYEQTEVIFKNKLKPDSPYFSNLYQNLDKLYKEMNQDEKITAGNTFVKNLDACRRFYEQYGASMIHDKFAEYEDRIAVGLVGEGSDCFGFDDIISTDHDYAIGFCMWLTDEDYDKIGSKLQEAYEKLINDMGMIFARKNGISTGMSIAIDGRRGVKTINGFYSEITGLNSADENMAQAIWTVSDEKLATATNGEIYKDTLGTFTQIRNSILEYRPEEIRRLKLGEEMHYFSQYAQSNYSRMMARKDYVSANLCISKGIESAMRIAYILNKQYAPYYKWMRKGMDNLTVLRNMTKLLDEIALCENQKAVWENIKYNPVAVFTQDKVVDLFEKIAVLIVNELNAQGIISGQNPFLEMHSRKLLGLDTVKENAEVIDKMAEQKVDKRTELIENIVKHEWQQFDKVKNEGGRADCRDDWNTFSIMRRSQYMTWNDVLLESYYNDLLVAENSGWNLIMEKYARMMASTAPKRYEEMKDQLPKRSEYRITVQEEIIKIQVEWMEEFAAKYPKMAGNARSIHTSEDSAYNTSYETYLRGEIGTYSEDTLLLYGRFIVEVQRANQNLAYLIMENTAKLYGYASVEDAESKLK